MIQSVYCDSCRYSRGSDLIGSHFLKKQWEFSSTHQGGETVLVGPVFGHGRARCFGGYGILTLLFCVFVVVFCMLHMIPWLWGFFSVCLHFFLSFFDEINVVFSLFPFFCFFSLVITVLLAPRVFLLMFVSF